MEEAQKHIEDSCYWFSYRNSGAVNEPLQGTHETDVAIVGGGFTGLWTAYFLKKLDPAVRVSLLEAETIGYGASGRNGGEACPTLDQSHLSAIEHFGLKEAKKMARIGKQNYEAFEKFASDCDFENTGWLYPALSKGHTGSYKEAHAAAQAVGEGGGWQFFNASEMRKQLDSPLYLGGVFLPEGGIVNPMKLVLKLKRESERAGVKIFEKTKVIRIKKGVVTSEQGTLRAKRVVLATDAYGHHLFPQLLRKFVPLYDYIIVSEPMPDAQLALIGWKGRQAVADARTFFNYYRLTHDNRILWGTSEAHYYFPNHVDPAHDYSDEHRSSLRVSFAKHFPQLKDLKFEYSWGGPIAATTRLSPCFGRLQSGTLLYGLGYTGQGVVCSRFAGRVLAHMALGMHSEILDLQMVKKAPIPYPPEPFRKLVIGMVLSALRKTDAGGKPGLLLRTLKKFKIGFSS
ncbi:MAG: FAD-binding oxidoreductase [bacterium]|nr:FAD-binding oxidoreductase [bacterium]